MNNKFIVIEGIEGSGKTSVVKYIINILNFYGIKNIITFRDPGSTFVAEKLRKIIKNSVNKENINKFSELLLLYAARSQLITNIIKPAIKANKWIIGDRYYLSSLAYQHGGRNINLKFINILNKFILQNIYPDLTIYLDVSPRIGLRRAYNRSKLDRIESESLRFFSKVRNKYKFLSYKNNKILTINAKDSLKNVKKEIYFKFKKWLKSINI